MEQASHEGSQIDRVGQPGRKADDISKETQQTGKYVDILIKTHTVIVKPLVGGHAVVLSEDAPGQPGEKQTAKYPPIASQHGCYQQDGSSTQGWKKQCPVIQNWCEKTHHKRCTTVCE